MIGRAPTRRVVPAKLVPAQLAPDVIVRERVLRRLSVEDRFTLVSAMPGYGKTAAVRQWIETVDVPVAWLSLDMLDQDVVWFWSNFLAALGTAVPGIDDEPAMLLWERGGDDRLFLGALVAELNELATPVVLVIDGASSDIDRTALEGVALLVERAGGTLRVVVTTRSDPPLPLARWRSVGWLNELREDLLRLTDGEALEIADRTDTAIRDPGEVVELNRRLRGWPIGLRMALLSRPGGVEPGPAAIGDAGSDRLLAEYLVVEVLEAMSEAERNAALSLCVLEWFDPDMCGELVGPDAATAVRQLLRRGMFLTVVDPASGSMRFHDLFRELMELELGWRDPAARLDLHRRAAMLWRSRGDLLSAYHHLSVIGETEQANELLVGPALALVDRGDLAALRHFARRLPTRQQVTNAGLAVDLGVVAVYADGTDTASRWCSRADALLAEPASPSAGREDVALRLLDLRCTISLLEADLDSALAAIERHRQPAGRPGDVFHRRFPIVAARVMLAARRPADADQWIGLAEQLDGPEIVVNVTVPTLRAWHEWLFGSLERAVKLGDAALAWMAERGIGAHHLAFDTLVTGGWCRLAVGDIDHAAALAARASADADTLASAWNQLQAGYLGARLALVTGDPTRCLQIVDELRQEIPFDVCHPYSERLLGIEIEALAAAGRVVEAVRAIDALEPDPRTRLLRARYEGGSEGTIAELLEGHEAWPALERIQAELLLRTHGNASAPSEDLVALVAECGRTGWVLPFLGFGPRVERLLRSTPLATIHPQLAATLDDVAPADRVDGPACARVQLTSRERSLVDLLPTHLTYAEMGERLYLSVNTVKAYLKSVYRKLGVSTRAEAVEASRQAGLL